MEDDNTEEADRINEEIAKTQIARLEFCKARDIDTQGMRLKQWIERNETTKTIEKISIEIELPEKFPQKYTSAVIRAAGKCTVKKYMEHPPAFDIRVVEAASG